MTPIAELEAAFADEIVVEHGGREYRLLQPSLSDASQVVSKWAAETEGKDADQASAYVRAMARAVVITLQADGPVPQALAERIVVQSGMIGSPIGRAALKLCGFPAPGAGGVPREADVPT